MTKYFFSHDHLQVPVSSFVGVCTYYPVSGVVDIIENNRIRTNASTDACDGSYEIYLQEKGPAVILMFD